MMIPDEYIRQLFTEANELLKSNEVDEDTLPTQFVRGRNPFEVDCMRHMTVFTKYNVIPRFCFGCYKVTLNLNTVMDLFKLMIIFQNTKLPADNARKCMVECRDSVSGTYKGFIYCSSVEEGEQVKRWIQNVLAEEIPDAGDVVLKRGCSEYAQSYPEYASIDQQGEVGMQYDESWSEYEEMVDNEFDFPPQPESFNRPSYNLHDAKVMLGWLRYAATIHDESYRNICGRVLEPWSNLNRPAMFPFK